jgi:uncharacterized protein YdeI (YjbR/CyaY-like superfamily)
MELNDALFFENRDEWRKWLEKYYEKEKEVWLIHYGKCLAKMGIQLEEAVEEVLIINHYESSSRFQIPVSDGFI